MVRRYQTTINNERLTMTPTAREVNIPYHIVPYDEIYFENLVGIVSMMQIMMYVG